MQEYRGYLTQFLPLIREGHELGLGTRQIAEALYAAGARADTSAPDVHELTEAHHIANLTIMAGYVLGRLGLSVRESHSQAEREALALREAGHTFRAIGEQLGVSMERARQLVLQAERLARRPDWYNALPARAQNFLHVNDWATLPELEAARAVAGMSKRELSATANLGKGACSALIAWIAGHGLRLQPEINLKAARVSARSDTVQRHDDVKEMVTVVAATTATGCSSLPHEEDQQPCSLTPRTCLRQQR